MAAVGRGGRASRSGTPRAAKTATATKTSAAKAARPTKRATTKASATSSRTPATKTAAKASATTRKPTKAAGAAAKTSVARSPKKKPTAAPAKSAKPRTKAPAAPSSRAAAARSAPTKKPAPAKASPNKRSATRSTSAATATKRPTKVSAKTTTTEMAIAVPRDSEWTARELAQIRAQLVAQLSEMQSEYNQSLIELDELQSSSTDGAGDDQADAGSKTFEREQELSIAANRLDLLTQIKRAVERIDAGTYGFCESCGKPIPKARLKAFPMATLDVACKQREERR
jgi:RNA polymerase-binding protein DksA